MKPFSEKVKMHRAMLGLSQRELAEKSGLSLRTITGYESGIRFPHAAQLYKLARALEVSIDYLKNDEAEDPHYGLERTAYGRSASSPGEEPLLDLEQMLKQNQLLFSGDIVSDETKDAYFRAVMRAYLEYKESSKKGLGLKKLFNNQT